MAKLIDHYQGEVAAMKEVCDNCESIVGGQPLGGGMSVVKACRKLGIRFNDSNPEVKSDEFTCAWFVGRVDLDVNRPDYVINPSDALMFAIGIGDFKSDPRYNSDAAVLEYRNMDGEIVGDSLSDVQDNIKTWMLENDIEFDVEYRKGETCIEAFKGGSSIDLVSRNTDWQAWVGIAESVIGTINE